MASIQEKLADSLAVLKEYQERIDGNGRTARFVMNTMLVTGGYPWRIITIEERDHYMAALEKASVDGDIRDFAQIVHAGISHQ